MGNEGEQTPITADCSDSTPLSAAAVSKAKARGAKRKSDELTAIAKECLLEIKSDAATSIVDDDEKYGTYIASEIRKFDNEITKQIVKAEIQGIIMKAHLGFYNAPPYRNTNPSEQNVSTYVLAPAFASASGSSGIYGQDPGKQQVPAIRCNETTVSDTLYNPASMTPTWYLPPAVRPPVVTFPQQQCGAYESERPAPLSLERGNSVAATASNADHAGNYSLLEL